MRGDTERTKEQYELILAAYNKATDKVADFEAVIEQ